MSMPGAFRGSAHRFQRQADGSEPGRLTREGRRYEREDRRRWSKMGREYERGVARWWGIKEIFSLIRNLQDADGQGTVSDEGEMVRGEAGSDKDKGERLKEHNSWNTSAPHTLHASNLVSLPQTKVTVPWLTPQNVLTEAKKKEKR